MRKQLQIRQSLMQTYRADCHCCKMFLFFLLSYTINWSVCFGVFRSSKSWESQLEPDGNQNLTILNHELGFIPLCRSWSFDHPMAFRMHMFIQSHKNFLWIRGICLPSHCFLTLTNNDSENLCCLHYIHYELSQAKSEANSANNTQQ